MRKMHLDFVRGRRPAGWPGWLLLLAGAAAMATAVGMDWAHYRPINEARNAELASLRASLDSRRPVAPNPGDAELLAEWRRAMAVTEELNRPWDRLLAALEGETDKPVALLSLSPDAGKGRLSLAGEARSFEEMLAYYRLLQQQEMLSAAALHTHEINRQDREKPVRFRVTAKWTAKP